MAGEISKKNYGIGIQASRILPRTKPDKATGGPGGIHPMDHVKVQGPMKEATPVVVTRTNWRHKSKEDPRQVELRNLLGGSFANL